MHDACIVVQDQLINKLVSHFLLAEHSSSYMALLFGSTFFATLIARAALRDLSLLLLNCFLPLNFVIDLVG